MHWVWNCSRTTGNVRMVLLAVADKAPGPDCVARMGTTEFRARLNTSKSVVVNAVDKALKSGELVITEPAIGSRAATYQLPHAVGYVRPASGARGPESRPVGDSYRSGIETPSSEQGSGIETGSENARGPESGPGGSGIETPRGPESGPLNQTTLTSKHESQPEPTGHGIPDAARPLVDSMTASGIVVRWPLQGNEWFPLLALIKKCGVPALVAYARRTADRTHVDSARYFMRGWAELPPAPAEGSHIHVPRPHLRAVGQSPEDRGIF